MTRRLLDRNARGVYPEPVGVWWETDAQNAAGAQYPRRLWLGVRGSRMPYVYLDHEADIGLEATGERLEEALRDGVQGLLALLVDPETVEPREAVPVQASGDDPGALYVALLNAVLAAVDLHGMFFRDFELTRLDRVDDHWVAEGTLYGEPIDLERHAVEIEVKAATYGGLLAEQTDTGWRLRCVLDL